MMKNKLFTRALALLLALSLLLALPITASAYATSGTAGDNITWKYDRSTKTLTFSGTGATKDYPFTETSAPYASALLQARTVVVGEGITELGDCFLDMPGRHVTKVVLPQTLQVISYRAFLFCESLKSITIPVSVKTIRYAAFSQCGITDFYYEGTRAQWKKVDLYSNATIQDDAFQTATIHCLGDTPYPGTPFTDINNHWGAETIKWAYESKLFSGVTDTEFRPDDNVNRGMLVTVLHRQAGEPAPSGTASFGDVPSGQYYAKAVSWANENGIVQGTGGNKFSPTTPLTREQLAKILYSYAQTYGKDTSSDSSALDKFSDRGSVSGWAVEAVQWAAAHGVLNGSGGKLDPKGSASRAMVAQVFYNCRDLLA